MNLHVATGCTTRTHRRNLRELPRAHGEAEILRRERTDRAYVDGVERVGIVELGAGRRGEDLAVPAICHVELMLSRYFVADANAARAENATLLVEHDAWSQIDDLGLAD